MITPQRSRDWALIKEIVTHPRVYPQLIDDFSPAPTDWKPIQDESVRHILVKDGLDVLGLWIFVPQNHICWAVHTCLLPKAYGLLARTAAEMMLEWIWKNTECLRIVTEVPAYNRHALRFALRAGLEQYGVNKKAVMKNGRLHDVIVLGISKPGVN